MQQSGSRATESQMVCDLTWQRGANSVYSAAASIISITTAAIIVIIISATLPLSNHLQVFVSEASAVGKVL